MAGHYWVKSNVDLRLPRSALLGGQDSNGDDIYVGRALHKDQWMPAKVIPDKHLAYVASGGAEHEKEEYEVLCEQKFEWVPCYGKEIPNFAVEAGRTKDGEPLYVGRVYHEGSHTVGKVHPSHECLYIPFAGEELSFEAFEILCLI